jgi:hypothetical protein
VSRIAFVDPSDPITDPGRPTFKISSNALRDAPMSVIKRALRASPSIAATFFGLPSRAKTFRRNVMTRALARLYVVFLNFIETGNRSGKDRDALSDALLIDCISKLIASIFTR